MPTPQTRSAKFARYAGAICMAIVLVLAGCSETKPLRVVTLVVSSTGTYTLDGKPVEYADLKHDLRALRSATGTIELHIQAATDANYQAVGQAVAAAQEAGIALVSFLTTPSK